MFDPTDNYRNNNKNDKNRKRENFIADNSLSTDTYLGTFPEWFLRFSKPWNYFLKNVL